MCEIQSIEFAFLLTLRAWMLSQYLLLNLLHSREPHHTKKKRNVEGVEFESHTSHISSCHFTSNIIYAIIIIHIISYHFISFQFISFHFISFQHIHLHISSCSFALTCAHVPSYAHLWVSSILAKYVHFQFACSGSFRYTTKTLISDKSNFYHILCLQGDSPRNHRPPSLRSVGRS